MEYWNASKDFEAFLLDVRDTCMLQTHNQAYHTLRAVLHVFRSHLTVEDALALPEDHPPPFPCRDALQREVKAIRPDHNLAPESAISDVANALRRSSIDCHDLDRVLAKLPPGAAEFWQAGT
jgi:uncharacterized protein (DUF2267 family)